MPPRGGWAWIWGQHGDGGARVPVPRAGKRGRSLDVSRKAAALGLEVPLSPCRAEGTGAELSLGGSFPFYSWPEPALCHFDTSGPRKPTGLAFEDICRDFENHPLSLPRTSSCFCSLEPQRCGGCVPKKRDARLRTGVQGSVCSLESTPGSAFIPSSSSNAGKSAN